MQAVEGIESKPGKEVRQTVDAMEILVDYIGDNNTAVDFLKMCGSEELQTKCEGKQTANG